MNDLNASAEANALKIENNYNGNGTSLDKILACLCPERFEQAKDIDIEHEQKRLQEITRFLSANPDVAEFSQGGTVVKREVMPPQIKSEMERIANNALRQNVKKMIQEQINLEKITLNALEVNKNDMRPDQLIDDSWLNVFQDNAKSIFREDAQKIWGQILAGELKQPESFSIATLNTLRYLSASDARAIEKLSRYIINSNYIFSKYITQENVLTEDELSSLKDNGLIRIESGKLSAKKSEHLFVQLSGRVLKLTAQEDEDKFLAVDTFIVLTKTTRELLSLTDCKAIAEEGYIQYICKKFACSYEIIPEDFMSVTEMQYQQGVFFGR